jgi:hypothetical protein
VEEASSSLGVLAYNIRVYIIIPMVLSETFWISFVTIGAGLVTAGFATCYKSKCVEFDCCGIRIKRDIQTEFKEDAMDKLHRGKSVLQDQS